MVHKIYTFSKKMIDFLVFKKICILFTQFLIHILKPEVLAKDSWQNGVDV